MKWLYDIGQAIVEVMSVDGVTVLLLRADEDGGEAAVNVENRTLGVGKDRIVIR